MAALRSRLEASRMDFEARVAAIGASIPGGSRGKSREEDPEEMRMQAVAREMRDRDRQHKMEVAAMTAQLQSRVRTGSGRALRFLSKLLIN